MPKVKHIAFTMYPVKDMRRARGFYENLIGLDLTHKFGEMFVEYHLDNGCFSLGKLEGLKPSANSGGIGFEVEDLDGFVKTLKEKGVKVKMEPFATPVCRMAVLIDTEGNAFTLHQKNPGRE